MTENVYFNLVSGKVEGASEPFVRLQRCSDQNAAYDKAILTLKEPENGTETIRIVKWSLENGLTVESTIAVNQELTLKEYMIPKGTFQTVKDAAIKEVMKAVSEPRENSNAASPMAAKGKVK